MSDRADSNGWKARIRRMRRFAERPVPALTEADKAVYASILQQGLSDPYGEHLKGNGRRTNNRREKARL